MTLPSGARLGAYEILSPLGQGGMGEVYRARDPRMGREVAIKVAVEAFSERFSREVHAVAALNHPNVCTIHDVGPDYLVMELVEGPTLAERIAEGALPVDEAIAVARQIAEALEAAHEQGIVHRDLKPANIKLRPDGTVKVLDFGLAKMGGTPAAPSDLSPTFSMQATQAGVILGTAAYMSPEQARGKAVDRRADIWAFGVVLYEMVTGRRLFQGEDLTDTLASVVKVEPDLRAAPPRLRRLLARCLAKDPAARLRHIGDAWDLLDDEPRAAVPAPAAGWRAGVVPLGIATAVLLVALAALAAVHFGETPVEPQAVTFTLDAPADAGFTNIYGGFAVSPDGRFVAFTATGRTANTQSLWLRPLDSLSARPLPGTEGGNFPTWSPDSRSLAFYADGRLRRLEIAGGAPLTLSDASDDRVSPTGAWSRDGVILFGSAAGLRRVPASGGGATLLTEVAEGETGHGYPQFLPDGRRFLFFVTSPNPDVQGVYASSLDAPADRTFVLRTDAKAVYVPPRAGASGYLLWLQDETLVAQPFDADSLERSGVPVSVTEEVGRNPSVPLRAAYWVSDAGLLTYFASTSVAAPRRPIVWMSRDGTLLGDAVPEGSHIMPALAPDAGRLAVARVTPGERGNDRDIWIWDFARETMTRLTLDGGGTPVWSRDGRFLAFESVRDGARGIYRMDVSGAGQAEILMTGPGQPLDWSPDGRHLLYRRPASAGGGGSQADMDLMALPLDGDRQPFPVANTRFRESHGKFSPDGRWVAYGSNETGRMEIYVQAFGSADAAARPAGRWQISNAGGAEPRWRADGWEIYYVSDDRRVMAVSLEEGPQGLQPGTPRALFPVPDMAPGLLHNFDVTGDGQRFLLALEPRDGDAAPASPRLTVVANWQAALRR